MPKVSQHTLDELEDAVADFHTEILESEYGQDTKASYVRMLENFVLWLNDDFDPAEYRKREKSGKSSGQTWPPVGHLPWLARQAGVRADRQGLGADRPYPLTGFRDGYEYE